MIVQLNPPLPLTVEGKGDGLAIAMIDYGPEYNILWVTALDASGEIWCAPNPKVRMQKNWSMGRTAIDWSRSGGPTADDAFPKTRDIEKSNGGPQ